MDDEHEKEKGSLGRPSHHRPSSSLNNEGYLAKALKSHLLDSSDSRKGKHEGKEGKTMTDKRETGKDKKQAREEEEVEVGQMDDEDDSEKEEGQF